MLAIIGLLLRALEILILVRVVLSFVPQWQRQPWGQIVVAITEPILKPIRSAVRIGGSGIYLDFSPMIALIGIQIVRMLLGF